MAFEPEQSQWFFGRERLTAELVTRLAGRLADGGPLAVVAPSGTGKSSLLRAGLVPALAGGVLAAPGSSHWPRIVLTPGPHPIAALAAQVAPLTGTDPAALADRLAAGPGRSTDVFREVLSAQAAGRDTAGARVIVIADQFEEIFTLCADAAERNAFVELLGTLASGTPEPDSAGAEPAGGMDAGPEPVALVVIGLRADFYGRCAAFPQLRAAMQRDQLLVGPMSVTELREAIERPAHAVGLELEPGLTELLLRDIGAREGEEVASGAYEAGLLPLIAYALQETWQHRAGGTLTVAGYQGTGGMQHAIANTAERTFDALPETSQQAAQPLFLRLVKIGDGTQDTRRKVGQDELLRHSRTSVAAEQVLTAFTQARLLTSNQDGIEISHEALLQAWPRLRHWISNDRAGNLISQDLEDAASAWDRSGHDHGTPVRR